MTQEEVKQYIDQIVVDSDVEKQFATLETLICSLIPYMLKGYKECREITQVTLGQLERVSSVCCTFFFVQIRSLIEGIQAEKTKPAYQEYINTDWDGDTKQLLDRVAPYLAVEHKTCELQPAIAESIGRFTVGSPTYYLLPRGIRKKCIFAI